jgi:hypothetical protein
MNASAKRLIAARQREEQAAKLCSECPTREELEERKAARREVESLAEEYLLAVRKWRELIEARVKRATYST